MSIQTKIEEIRRKPEHIRMRYVLVSVFISMLIISVLWIFSITTSFQSQKENEPLPTETTPQTNQNAPNTDTTQPSDTSQSNTSQSDTAPSLNEWIKK